MGKQIEANPFSHLHLTLIIIKKNFILQNIFNFHKFNKTDKTNTKLTHTAFYDLIALVRIKNGQKAKIFAYHLISLMIY